jgi:predicted ArsR family transcriptional regulator
MSQNEMENRELQLVYALMQPTRQKIIKVLRASKEPLYIKQIAAEIGEKERNVSFHLATLAEYGFVEGEYREIEALTHRSRVTGRAAKFYRLTPKVEAVIKKLEAVL